MPYIYLGTWEYTTGREDGPDGWRLPVTGAGMVWDFRSLAQMAAQGGTPEGRVLAAYDSPVSHPSLRLLGDSLGHTLTAQERQEIAQELGLGESIVSTTLGQAILELQTSHTDPSGQERWRPRLPDRKGRVVLTPGVSMEAPRGSSAWGAALARLREDYKAIRAGAMAGRLPPDMHRRQLWIWGHRHRLDYHQLIPTGYPDEEPAPPSTIVSDSFDTDTSADWTADLGAFQIDAGDSNVLEPTSTAISASQ